MKIKAFNLGVPGSNPGGLIKKGLFTGFVPISKSFLLLSAEVKKNLGVWFLKEYII